MVIGFADRVLRGEPQILPDAEGIFKAGMREGSNRGVHIVDSLNHAGAAEGKNRLPDFLPVLSGKDQFRLSGSRNPDLRVLIHIPIGVTGDGNGLFPGSHGRMYAPHQNGRPEYGSVQDRPDRSVGTLPHLLQTVFLHPLGIGRDGCAFDRHAVLQRRFGAFHRYPVLCLIPMLQPQIIILRLQIHIRQYQGILYLSPEDSGHLVSVHLHQRGFHLNLCHFLLPPFLSFILSAQKKHR